VNKHPFKRGAMTFEDYNYALYNPYILVQTGDNKQVGQEVQVLSEDHLQAIKGSYL
jgi:hypothetical protein